MRKDGTWGPSKQAYDKAYYHRLKKEGICPKCRGKNGVPELGRVRCEACLEKDRGRKR